MARTARRSSPTRRITQRANRRRQTFFLSVDHAASFHLTTKALAAAAEAVWAWRLIPNRVHLIATPREPRSLAAAVAMTHARHAPDQPARGSDRLSLPGSFRLLSQG
jgi:REP element-mobilizing transposase RayT